MAILFPRPYHVGLVVADLDEAAERHSELFGTQWCSERRIQMEVAVDGAPMDIDLRVRYSIGDEPQTELIEDFAGNVWSHAALGLNHVGHYVQDITAGVEALVKAGMPCRVHDVGGPGGTPRLFAYHQDPSGLWVELVHVSFRDNLRAWAQSTLDNATDPGGILNRAQS